MAALAIAKFVTSFLGFLKHHCLYCAMNHGCFGLVMVHTSSLYIDACGAVRRQCIF